MRENFTIVCVLSNNVALNKMWIKQHSDVIGDEFPVLLVDNTTFYDATQLLLLEKAALLGWRVVRNRLPVVPRSADDTHLTHSMGIDVAVQYITTPYIITVDNDLFIPNIGVLDYLVEQAISNDAAVVGWEIYPHIAFPYITPTLSVYKVDVVRAFPLAARWVSPQTMMERYVGFYAPQHASVDEHKDLRLAGYLDVGQYTHYEAVLAGHRVVKLDLEKLREWGVVHKGNLSDTRHNDPNNPFHMLCISLPIKLVGGEGWERIALRTDEQPYGV